MPRRSTAGRVGETRGTPVVEERRQLSQGRAARIADEESAGGGAEQERQLICIAEQQAETVARIETIARSGHLLRVLAERSSRGGDAAGSGGDGVDAGAVDHHLGQS